MKEELITNVEQRMQGVLDNFQFERLHQVLVFCVGQIFGEESAEKDQELDYVELFLSAKRIEGRSEKSLLYYRNTIDKMIKKVNKPVRHITTDDLRVYLAEYQAIHNSGKVTIDNIRRILSTFFGWLEDEDYIIKSPVRRMGF